MDLAEEVAAVLADRALDMHGEEPEETGIGAVIEDARVSSTNAHYFTIQFADGRRVSVRCLEEG